MSRDIIPYNFNSGTYRAKVKVYYKNAFLEDKTKESNYYPFTCGRTSSETTEFPDYGYVTYINSATISSTYSNSYRDGDLLLQSTRSYEQATYSSASGKIISSYTEIFTREYGINKTYTDTMIYATLSNYHAYSSIISTYLKVPYSQSIYSTTSTSKETILETQTYAHNVNDSRFIGIHSDQITTLESFKTANNYNETRLSITSRNFTVNQERDSYTYSTLMQYSIPMGVFCQVTHSSTSRAYLTTYNDGYNLEQNPGGIFISYAPPSYENMSIEAVSNRIEGYSHKTYTNAATDEQKYIIYGKTSGFSTKEDRDYTYMTYISYTLSDVTITQTRALTSLTSESNGQVTQSEPPSFNTSRTLTRASLSSSYFYRLNTSFVNTSETVNASYTHYEQDTMTYYNTTKETYSGFGENRTYYEYNSQTYDSASTITSILYTLSTSIRRA